ncbi:glycosyltransferase [Ramlibacter sp. MMS24-I3-19]|uniref:glycosyltransferase n=1 Tax=Ramlibacter sp. MMS24-I3-19 TaxID=3416606 RepID=UPI003D035B47
MIAFWFSVLVCALVLRQLVALHWGLRQLRLLTDVEPLADAELPTLSIIVSALDEAATIEPALRSLLALDHPHLQVIAIDDRSTDGTGAILDRLARDDPRLRVIHVAALPDGWLGKVHALHLGAQAASGRFLLFTDADVHMAPDALRRALGHCVRERLDHVAVLPQLHVRQSLLAALLVESQALFHATLPPWKLATSPRVYVGLGAFNLVRADAYRRAGGHEALKLEVLDDLALGRRLKLHGARQGLLLGEGAVALEWYRDAHGFMRGVEKNSFAAAAYSVPRALAASLGFAALRIWPLVGLFATAGATRWVNALAVLGALAIQWRVLRTTQWPAGCLLWFPLTAVLMLAVLWRAVLLTLRRGGIAWRGTFYPLEALRAARRASATWR